MSNCTKLSERSPLFELRINRYEMLASTLQEHIDRLTAARLQCDIMGSNTLLVSRTDAEAANLVRTPNAPTV